MAQQRDYDTDVRRSITILKSPEELYQAWRQPENLVRFVPGTKSIEVLDNTHLKWTAEIPGLGPETWTTEIINDQANEFISWRTIDNPRIDQEGSVAFNKGLHFHMGLMHGPKYIPRLFDYTRQGKIDPSFCFTHRFGLDDIPQAYATFKSRADNCMKVLVNVA